MPALTGDTAISNALHLGSDNADVQSAAWSGAGAEGGDAAGGWGSGRMGEGAVSGGSGGAAGCVWACAVGGSELFTVQTLHWLPP